MLVPVVLAASMSWSLAKVPPVIETVALASVRLSGSVTATAPASVTAPAASVNCWLVATLPSVGGWLRLVTETVVVTAVLRLLEAPPSLSTQVTVRVGSEPKSVGFWPALNVTVSSTPW